MLNQETHFLRGDSTTRHVQVLWLTRCGVPVQGGVDAMTAEGGSVCQAREGRARPLWREVDVSSPKKNKISRRLDDAVGESKMADL